LAFTLAESVGTLAIIALQSATYRAKAALVDVVVGEAEVAAVDVVLAEVDVVLAAVEVVAGVLVVVELLVVELLLPHPATSTPQSSASASDVDRAPIISVLPWIDRTLARGRRASRRTSWGARLSAVADAGGARALPAVRLRPQRHGEPYPSSTPW
jgi:hypothetical protein